MESKDAQQAGRYSRADLHEQGLRTIRRRAMFSWLSRNKNMLLRARREFLWSDLIFSVEKGKLPPLTGHRFNTMK